MNNTKMTPYGGAPQWVDPATGMVAPPPVDPAAQTGPPVWQDPALAGQAPVDPALAEAPAYPPPPPIFQGGVAPGQWFPGSGISPIDWNAGITTPPAAPAAPPQLPGAPQPRTGAFADPMYDRYMNAANPPAADPMAAATGAPLPGMTDPNAPPPRPAAPSMGPGATLPPDPNAALARPGLDRMAQGPGGRIVRRYFRQVGPGGAMGAPMSQPPRRG